MTAPAILMREIHRLRRFARDLQEHIDRYPKQVKAQQAKLAKQEENHKEGQENLKKLKIAINEKEVTLKATHATIKKHEKQADEASEAKVAAALKVQLATDRALAAKLEEEILVGLTEIEEKTVQLPDLAKAVVKAKTDFTEWEKTSKVRYQEQTVQLKETLAKLKEVEKGIPPEIRVMYDRMVASIGPECLSSVENGTCTACMTEITVQMLHELKKHMLSTCKACGRILYLPETTTEPEA